MMSYIRMDHAEWVERNNAAGKRLSVKRKQTTDRYGNKIGYSGAPDTLSPFQRRAMDVLGIVGRGIYNAPIAWKSVDWNSGGGMSVVWNGSLATWDFSNLTLLVFLCHEGRIRCQIESAGPGRLRLSLHPRHRHGGMVRNHPDLQKAVDDFRKYFPADHRIAGWNDAFPGPELVDAATPERSAA